jgi:hypothetical protein
MNWTPIDPKLKLLCGIRPFWTESALDCYNSDKNCFNCANFRTTGMNWSNGTCKMPITVQHLIDTDAKKHSRSYYRNI